MDELNRLLSLSSCHILDTESESDPGKADQFRLMEACITRMNDLIVITDAEPIDEPGPKILYVNDAFVARTGYSREETIGRSPRFLQGINTQRDELTKIKNALRQWQPVRAELINYTKSGQEFWLELDIFPIANKSGWFTHWVSVERDITERKQIEKKLFESEHRFKLIAKATADTIWDWDLISDTIWWSEGIQTMFGYQIGELEQDSHSRTSRIHPDDLQYVLARINGTIEGETNNWVDEYRFRCNDGNYVHVMDRGFVIRADDGKALRMVGGMTDVSHEKQIQRELKQLAKIKHAQQVAELANQAKSSFLATMSHEIRTPISGVIGMVDVLHQTSLKDYQIEMVDIIRDSANSLLRIIDDILDFSKIESGKLELELTQFSPERNAGDVCLLLDRMAMEKNVELSLFINSNLPEMVVGDELRLRQVLINLVGNAIKFSSKSGHTGKVRLSANLHTESDNKSILEFVIEDNGIGMSEQTLSRLFTPFMQADASTTRHFGGTGLGLTITHRLVELMQGEVLVESRLNTGSVFKVHIPFTPAPLTILPREKNTHLNQLLCIAVGDPDGLLTIWIHYLTAYGATIIQTDDLESIQWQELCQSHRQHEWLLLIDDQKQVLEPLDSLQIVNSIRPLHPPLRLLKIGRGHRREIRCDNAGSFYIDGNCLSRVRFYQSIDAALGNLTQCESLEHGYHEVNFISPARHEALEQNKLLLLAEDNETNQKVISRQLALLGYATDVVSNGAEAFEKIMTERYALLITDIHMPVMDGYELIARVRAADSPVNIIPIVALSANAIREEVNNCKQLGANEYLVKPALLRDLKCVLDLYLSGATNLRAKSTETQLQTEPSMDEQDVHLNTSILRELIGDDEDIVLEFLADYLRNAKLLRKEIEISFRSLNLEFLASNAHILKSSSRAVGALNLGKICEHIEYTITHHQPDTLDSDFDAFNKEFDLVASLINQVFIANGVGALPKLK